MCMYGCVYVRMYVCMYVCMCMCVTKLWWCVWRVTVTCADIFLPDIFLPALQCHLPCMQQHCGPGMGWMRCSMIFCAPCGATRCATWQPRLSYSHKSDDDDIEQRYLVTNRRHARPNHTQARHPMPWVPRLPRKTKVDASLCHACHVKWRWM